LKGEIVVAIIQRQLAIALLLVSHLGFALGAGDTAPDFSMKNQDGKDIKLSSFAGKPVLMYFYPHDDTPGCTKEAKGLKESFEKYKAQGAVILGISRQDEKSHQQFKTKYDLPFDLLVDSNGSVGKMYGIGMMPLLGTFQRQSVLIGPDRKIIRFYYNVDPEKHADEVLKDLVAAKK
jgi:thioredoxin-dependent peroxiredoxin